MISDLNIQENMQTYLEIKNPFRFYRKKAKYIYLNFFDEQRFLQKLRERKKIII